MHRFSVFAVCWTILLFVAGALVTSKDAALSVTDWPKSHGTWIPPLTMLQGGDLFEFSHRVVAGGLGLLTLSLAVWLWVKEKRPWLRWLGLTAVLGVAVQAILGGQVVIRLLHYWLPIIHACFAQIVFGAVLAISVFTSKWWVSDQPLLQDSGAPSIHALVILNAGVIYLQVILVLGLGAYWSRLTTADAPQPMPVMVTLTVIHTVVGAILFAFSVLIVLMCYRLIPRGREVAATASRRVTAG
ncbi:MAG: hypothetical protein DMG53_27225 [Acidobacteria bacterium]|nr:MAG: hypothetical protein DMG53_27225 [Acidobacteriota bacterium]